MKTLVLGDIHGRKEWKDIISRENPDKVIFLGDYVSTHDNYTAQEQTDNLEDILSFKESNPGGVILIRGNHDIQHIMHDRDVSGYFPGVAKWFDDNENYDRFMRNTQWIYEESGKLFSHAGVSKVWMERCGFTSVSDINGCNDMRTFTFYDRSFNPYGDDPNQSCVWIRPVSLSESCIDGYDQFVGHTTLGKIADIQDLLEKEGRYIDNHIWLCDCRLKEYIIIENDEVIVGKVS